LPALAAWKMRSRGGSFFTERFIGQRMPRKADLRLQAGRVASVDDIVPPGIPHAAFIRRPIARGIEDPYRIHI
jgi:hypothetical protein